MIVWFLTIAVCGISGIAGHPKILRALSPTYALAFLVGNFSIAFFSLAAVVLAITGAAALLIADGWHPLAISRRLGHSTITVTMDRYGHLLPSLEADLIARTAETFTRALAATATGTGTGTDNVTPLR